MDPLDVKSHRGLGPHTLFLFKVPELVKDLLFVSNKLKQPSYLSGNNSYLHFNVVSCGGGGVGGGEKSVDYRKPCMSAEQFRATCHIFPYGENT